MVVIKRVGAVNFRRLDLSKPLELGRGVVFIKGRNESGKSTLIEAMLFGLYGDYRIVGNLRGNPQAGYSDVINHHAKRAKVEIEFEVDGKSYRVERILERTRDAISQSMARLVEVTDNDEKLIASTVSGVNEQIAKLLRVSWREMLITNVVAQKDLERIIRMKGDDREKVINLMMGLEAYNKATDRIEEERRKLQYKVEEVKARLEEVERTIAILEEQKKNISLWQKKLSVLEKELPEYLKREEHVKSVLKYLEELSTAIKQKNDLEKEQSTTEKRLTEIQEQLSYVLKEKSRIEVDIQHLKSRISENSRIKERVLQLESEANKIAETIKGLKIPLWIKIVTPILTITGFLLIHLHFSFILLTVIGVILGITYLLVKNRQRSNLSRERSLIEGELAGLKMSFEAFKKMEDDLQRLNDQKQEFLNKMEELEKQYDELKTRTENIKKIILTISPPPIPRELEDQFMGLDLNQNETAEKMRLDYTKKYDEAYKSRIETEASINELRERITEAEKQISQLAMLKVEFEKKTQELESLSIEVEVRKKSVELMQEVSRIMRESFAPSVEEYMSWIISYFTGGRYKAVRLDPNTYDLEVYDTDAGSWLRRDIYSGGTNDQFLLALRIAFTLSLLPSVKGFYPRFLVLDEPLSSSDVERRSNITKFLTNELTRFFDQLFIITHVEVEEPPNSRVIMLEDGRVYRVYTVGGDEVLETGE